MIDISIEQIRTLADRDRSEGQTELLTQLKKLSYKELHKLDPALLARLSAAQRQELFAKPSPQPQQTKPINNRRPKRPSGRPILPRRIWNKLPLFFRSQMVGAMTASTLLTVCIVGASIWPQLEAMAFAPASLSQNSNTWSRCSRLTPNSDGCNYHVSSGLSWHQAADLLTMDVNELWQANTHLQHHQSQLAPGDNLIIWRGLIRLEN